LPAEPHRPGRKEGAMIRATVLAIILASCGGTGSVECQAIVELRALDARFVDGDINTALDDRDLDGLTAALDNAGDEAARIRDELEAADADTQLVDAASGFTRGANLLSATFSAATIRQSDLDSGLAHVEEARDDLEGAESALSCGADS
jgi:hypothetical protein